MHSVHILGRKPLGQSSFRLVYHTLLVHGEAGTVEVTLRDAYLDELALLLELSCNGYIYEEGEFLISVFYEQGIIAWHAMGYQAKDNHVDITFTTHTPDELHALAYYLRRRGM